MSEPSKREQGDDGEKRYWLDDSRNVDKIVIALVVVCAGLFAADFFYHKHVHFAFEGWFGFFGWFHRFWSRFRKCRRDGRTSLT